MQTAAWQEMVRRISTICVTGEFKRLQRQLEELYRRAGVTQPAVQAYQDALLSILAEDEDMGALLGAHH